MGEIDVLLVLMGDKSQVPFWYVHHISLSHLFFANQMRSSLKKYLCDCSYVVANKNSGVG